MSDEVLGGIAVICRNCGELLWNDDDETPAPIAVQAHCGANVRWDEVSGRTEEELSELATAQCSYAAEADALRAACLSHNDGVTPGIGQVWFICIDDGVYLLTGVIAEDTFGVEPIDGSEDPIVGASVKQLLESGRYLYPSLAAYEEAQRPRPYVRSRRSPMAD
jgi:hypothetical protein